MVLGKVIGNVWATKKEDSLNGYKLMIVEVIKADESKTSEEIIAVDMVGAGVSDMVLVSKGSSARVTLEDIIKAPIDAVIVGIVDGVELGG